MGDSSSVLSPERSYITSGTCIAAMSPLGIYWRKGPILKSATYVNAGDLIFTACHFDEDHLPEKFYSEFDDPSLEQVRLHGALMLSLDFDHGLALPAPTAHRIQLAQQPDLSDQAVLYEIEDLVRHELGKTQPSRAHLPPPPSCAGGPNYDFRAEDSPIDLQQQIWEAIDLHDYALMRGLASLLQGETMFRSMFRTEALYSLFVSLDASFSLVMRQLKASGLSSPSAYDAQEFIEAAFNDPPSEMRYFEEFYDDRIRALHPESRFGTFPYLPLSVSEGYQLARALRAVWRFLILGQP